MEGENMSEIEKILGGGKCFGQGNHLASGSLTNALTEKFNATDMSFIGAEEVSEENLSTSVPGTVPTP